MAETDIAKVVSLIMENPKLVEEIKALASEDREISESKETVTEELTEAAVEETAAIHTGEPQHQKKRGELLEALKPYMSNERKKAIDSFMAIADILDMMRAK